MALRGNPLALARSQSLSPLRGQLPLHKGAFRRRHEKAPLEGAFTAAVSVQKTPGESLMFLYEIDELYDFAVSELAIPIKMV